MSAEEVVDCLASLEATVGGLGGARVSRVEALPSLPHIGGDVVDDDVDLCGEVDQTEILDHLEPLLEVVNVGLVVRTVGLLHTHTVEVTQALEVLADDESIGDDLREVSKRPILDQHLELNTSKVSCNHSPPPPDTTAPIELRHNSRKIFLQRTEDVHDWTEQDTMERIRGQEKEYWGVLLARGEGDVRVLAVPVPAELLPPGSELPARALREPPLPVLHVLGWCPHLPWLPDTIRRGCLLPIQPP